MSSLRLPSCDHVRHLLGAKHISGGLMVDIVWALDSDRRMSADVIGKCTFITWLHELFLKIVLPKGTPEKDLLNPRFVEQIPCEFLCMCVRVCKPVQHLNTNAHASVVAGMSSLVIVVLVLAVVDMVASDECNVRHGADYNYESDGTV